jgi:hypothetical protein
MLSKHGKITKNISILQQTESKSTHTVAIKVKTQTKIGHKKRGKLSISIC